MVMGAGEFRRDEGRARAFEQHVADLREVSAEELHETFAEDAIIALDLYQRQVGVPGILTEPFQSDFEEYYGSKAYLLANNTALYPDVIEEMIESDDVYRDIIQTKERIEAKQRSGQIINDSLENVADALRTRRSVLVYLIELQFIEAGDDENGHNGDDISQSA